MLPAPGSNNGHLPLIDPTGHAAFEVTQLVTPVLRIRNVSPITSDEVLLELLSQVRNLECMHLKSES
jgi:hypothetical protein